MKTIAIIQARMGSSRLPGKIMLNLEGETVLKHVIDRVKQAKEVDEIIVATTTLGQDDILVEKAKEYGVYTFRGSEQNVLERYYQTATQYNADIIVRITSDCPLIDPRVIDKVVRYYKAHTYDLVTSAGNAIDSRTYPRGLDAEVFSYEILKIAYHKAQQPHQKEHVTPYIYENISNIQYCYNNTDYSDYRWTLDTPEDYRFIQEVYAHFYKGEHTFYMEDIIKFIETNPEIGLINKHIEQKKV